MSNDYAFTRNILNAIYRPLFGEEKVPGDFYMDVYNGTWQDNRESDPFSKGNDKRLKVKSAEDIPHVNENLKKMVGMLDETKQQPELKDKPAIQQFYGFQQDMLNMAASGVDVGGYLSAIPGGERAFYFVDMRDTKRVFPQASAEEAAEKYDEMFREMGYPTVWEELKNRVGIEAEMDGRILSPEQKAAYAERITESNKKRIDAYNRMMSDESRDKFKRFYENFDDPQTGTISGGRGYKSSVNELMEENVALVNGFDPTRLAEYRLMRRLTEDCKESEALFEAADRPELLDYHNKMLDVISMDPVGKKFENQREFDSYMASYHETVNAFMEEAKRPEVKKAVEEGLASYRKKVNPGEPGIDRGEEYRRNRMITVAESNVAGRLARGEKPTLDAVGFVNNITGPNTRIYKGEKELSDAMSMFNTKRTDGWLSSESKEHRALREASERLQRDMKTFRSGVYQDGPNKGKVLSDFERENLRDSMEKSLKEMSRAAEVYITKSKNPSTDAGKARLEGARRLAGVTERLGAELSAATRSHDAAAGIEDDFETKMAEAMEFQEKDFLSNDKDLNYIRNMNLKRLQLATRNKPFGTRQDFKNTLSNVIAGKSIDIEIKKHRMSPSPQEATLKMAKAADQLRADPVFNKMADEIFDSPKLKEQLHIMEPGEILAKYLTRKQNEKMKETAAQKQQELKKKDPRLGMGGPKK